MFKGNVNPISSVPQLTDCSFYMDTVQSFVWSNLDSSLEITISMFSFIYTFFAKVTCAFLTSETTESLLVLNTL